MTAIVTIRGGNVDSYYDQIQEYLRLKYQTYPSKLLPLTIEGQERQQYSEDNARGCSVQGYVDGTSIYDSFGNYVGDTGWKVV